VVDGRSLTDASAFRGIGTYLRNLVAHLPVTDASVALLIEEPASCPPGVDAIPILRAPVATCSTARRSIPPGAPRFRGCRHSTTPSLTTRARGGDPRPSEGAGHCDTARDTFVGDYENRTRDGAAE